MGACQLWRGKMPNVREWLLTIAAGLGGAFLIYALLVVG